jgi:hypothetical protein
MPDRRVGMQRLLWAVYGAAYPPPVVLLDTLPNARLRCEGDRGP